MKAIFMRIKLNGLLSDSASLSFIEVYGDVL